MSKNRTRLNQQTPAVGRDGLTEPQRAELHFWQLCYAAAISAGPYNASNGNARMAADQGVADLRKKMSGIATAPNDCVSSSNSGAQENDPTVTT